MACRLYATSAGPSGAPPRGDVAVARAVARDRGSPLMSGTPALPNVGRPWASRRRRFRIEVPCNISCNISRRIGVSAGQSRPLTARCHSLEKDKTAGQKPSDLRILWWPGAGSNRRPSDFQAERARPERSSRAKSVLRRREFVPYRPVTPELVLANPSANWSPATLRPSRRISPSLQVRPVALQLQV